MLKEECHLSFSAWLNPLPTIRNSLIGKPGNVLTYHQLYAMHFSSSVSLASVFFCCFRELLIKFPIFIFCYRVLRMSVSSWDSLWYTITSILNIVSNNDCPLLILHASSLLWAEVFPTQVWSQLDWVIDRRKCAAWVLSGINSQHHGKATHCHFQQKVL